VTCLTAKALAGLEAGTLEGDADAAARAHVKDCPDCEARREDLVSTARLLGSQDLELAEIVPAPRNWDAIRERIEAEASDRVSVAIGCAWCKGKLARPDAVYCSGCLAPHHADCWEHDGRCAACGVTTRVRAEAPRVAASRWRAPRRPGRWAIALGALVLAGGGVAALDHEHKTTKKVSKPRPANPHEAMDLESERLALVATIGATQRALDERAPFAQEQASAAVRAFEAFRSKCDGRQEAVVSVLEREIALLEGGACELRGGGALRDAVRFYTEAADRTLDETTWRRALLGSARVRTALGSFDAALDALNRLLARDPGDVEAIFLRGRLFASRGAHVQAVIEFTAALQHARDHQGRIWRALGDSDRALLRLAEAREAFSRAIALGGRDTASYATRGLVRHEMGDDAGALEDLDEAVNLEPGAAGPHLARASFHFARRELAAARADFELALAGDADCDEAVLGLGQTLEWQLDYEGAAARYDQVAREERMEPSLRARALTARARLLALRSDRLEVQAEVDRKLADPATGTAPARALGDLAAEGGAARAKRAARARAAYDQALALDPGLVAALTGRARLALSQGDAKGARADLDAAVKLLAARPSPPAPVAPAPAPAADAPDADLAEVEALLGLAALADSDLKGAIAHFEEGLAADPSSAFAVSGLAAAYARNGDRVTQRSLLEKARRLAAATDPKDETAFFYAQGLAHAHDAIRSRKVEHYAEARECFARAVARNPLHALAFLERARVASAWHGWDFALEDATSAIEADPFLHEALELRGFLRARDLPEVRDPVTLRPKELRDPRLAFADFTRAIEAVDGSVIAAQAYYGRALVGSGSQVQDDLKRVLATVPDTLEAQILIGTASPEELVAAIAYYELAVKRLDGRDARLASLKAAARHAAEAALAAARLAHAKKDDEAALAQLDRAFAFDPELAAAYGERGAIYLKTGEFLLGILDLARSVELDPRLAGAFYNKVYQVAYVVDLNRVITELNKLVVEHPDLPHVVFARGFFYVAKSEFKKYAPGDLDAGIADFDRTLALDPKAVVALIYRAFLEEKRGLSAKALADLDAALALDKDNGLAHFFKARIHLEAHEYEKALPELEAALEKGFDGRERVKNDPIFTEIAKDPRLARLLSGSDPH
jgi:tetratricopeptide (TPR) repeat protein